LLTAVICLWIFGAGVVKNGVIELGGAFAGSFVSLFELNKIWGKDDSLESQPARAGNSFTYEEVLRALDLREASPYAATREEHHLPIATELNAWEMSMRYECTRR
jgi:hypothetical protein